MYALPWPPTQACGEYLKFAMPFANEQRKGVGKKDRQERWKKKSSCREG